ncbi:aminodeoxychorismate synthase component I [Streptacidiphilus sp. 4-A2]|nr:aminodeoxychorismate synthase component I [Streptacidiphilus sp. 4-A2]
MRTLLIDNYDSFTYNLFHYLAEVNGEEPEVVVNDDPRWQLGHLADFDNVVLSPGPGHPERPADFGICREVLEQGGLPVLGVCLGHQGIAALYGGRVQRAPEPFHGRVSPVLHDGRGLFAGLPSPFEAVRYHSLAVDRLPDELEATAWTPDGILMGLRHRTRPQWGLQFHPESIGGSHGRELLANFRTLTERHGLRPRRPAARRAVPSALRPAEPRGLRVLTRPLPTRWDDETAYQELFQGDEHAYWLDSSRPDAGLGRFSVMGDARGPLARTATADVATGTVTVRSAGGTETVRGSFLDWLDRDLAAIAAETPELPCDFALGWVGYLGYELKAECGADAAHRSQDPDAVLIFSDHGLVLDHATGTTHLLALAEDGDESAALAWLETAQQQLEAAAGRPGSPAEPPEPLPELRLRHDHSAYLDLIDACQQEIAAGETYEVCLTNLIEAECELDPWQSYRFLRRTSPAPFAALLQFGELNVLSTSPERFLRIGADRVAEAKPIKGTRPRGATEQEDRALAAELLASEKDRAENLMIVDLVRNDLGRCAEVGSVEAEEIFRVETYARAHQLVSTVRARLRTDSSPVRCLQAAFPPGSMTGAPKLRTMQLIDRLEAGPRGVYSGAIGYFSLTGAADLSVVIRTALITPGLLRYGVGGAVIALSDPQEEVDETAVKAAPVLALTGARFPLHQREPLLG